MVRYDEAFRLSEKCFKESHLNGVGEVLEGDDFWLFKPDLNGVCYGAFSVIVYSDNIERSRLLWLPDELEMKNLLDKSKTIFKV